MNFVVAEWEIYRLLRQDEDTARVVHRFCTSNQNSLEVYTLVRTTFRGTVGNCSRKFKVPHEKAEMRGKAKF